MFNNNAGANKKGKGKSSSNLEYIGVITLITNPSKCRISIRPL